MKRTILFLLLGGMILSVFAYGKMDTAAVSAAMKMPSEKATAVKTVKTTTTKTAKTAAAKTTASDSSKKAKKELEDGKATIADKEPELEKAREALDKAQEEIGAKETLLAEKETELEQGKKALETSGLTLQLGEMQQKLTMEGLVNEQKSIDSAYQQNNTDYC